MSNKLFTRWQRATIQQDGATVEGYARIERDFMGFDEPVFVKRQSFIDDRRHRKAYLSEADITVIPDDQQPGAYYDEIMFFERDSRLGRLPGAVAMLAGNLQIISVTKSEDGERYLVVFEDTASNKLPGLQPNVLTLYPNELVMIYYPLESRIAAAAREVGSLTKEAIAAGYVPETVLIETLKFLSDKGTRWRIAFWRWQLRITQQGQRSRVFIPGQSIRFPAWLKTARRLC